MNERILVFELDVAAHRFGEELGEIITADDVRSDVHHDLLPLCGRWRHHEAIRLEEGDARGDADALVAVEERVAFREPVHVHGREARQGENVGVLWRNHGRLELTFVARPVEAPAIVGDDVGVEATDLVDREERDLVALQRFASRSRSSRLRAGALFMAASVRAKRSASVSGPVAGRTSSSFAAGRTEGGVEVIAGNEAGGLTRSVLHADCADGQSFPVKVRKAG